VRGLGFRSKTPLPGVPGRGETSGTDSQSKPLPNAKLVGKWRAEVEIKIGGRRALSYTFTFELKADGTVKDKENTGKWEVLH
jgi:hypothetical protein